MKEMMTKNAAKAERSRRDHHRHQPAAHTSSHGLESLLLSLVIACIDCCNSVPVGLPVSPVSSLKRVQNAAAQLILGLSRQSYFTPVLQRLHWPPVKFQLTFKVATIMHDIFHHRSTPYLNNVVAFCTNNSQQCQLRTSTSRSVFVC